MIVFYVEMIFSAEIFFEFLSLAASLQSCKLGQLCASGCLHFRQ